MKILHTADWHLGKKLHKHDLSKDHQMFLDWLINLIQEKSIDLLLISGDIFDLANPPIEARTMYYWFLRQMIQLKCKIIVTGGNHDSALMLDAPKEILQLLDIKVVGGATNPIVNEIVALENLVVCAVPYLRDADLRQAIEGESGTSRIENVRLGIKKHYDELAEICQKKYLNVPIIAMGHLYANGSISSESEREIQIGNLASVDGNDFSKTFNYVALGHIHRPQIIGGNERIRYSGSPIPLSFSEKNDQKIVIILEVSENKIQQISEVQVPKFRELKLISGTIENVKSKLIAFQNEAPLKSFLEVEVIEDNFNPLIIKELNDLIGVFDDENAIVLKHKISFKNEVKSSEELFVEGQNLEDISEKEMLQKRLERENALSEIHKEMMMEAFTELLLMVEQDDEN
ncbi:Nuclease SbcCD subunit D [Emticicia aquatica]|jgi:exonuclease SbcD|uniref:Nuclease SbcCD subunit D n=1 Tax=Emticicia aquatica TaxID=1681835 RepID=A0ABM9AKY2_9BACT|nr:exonuclease subunit SbcD [Emticicia aquatica]CAH0993902.1 Nuclease SbcCD subunit D [Emticicia aquatica]